VLLEDPGVSRLYGRQLGTSVPPIGDDLRPVSKHGNVVSLRAQSGGGTPEDMIDVDYVLEGYELCADGVLSGYDAASSEFGFKRATIQQSNGPDTTPLIITRKTQDGKFRLIQRFDFDGLERDLMITSTVENGYGGPLADVLLFRYFDGDMEGTVGTGTTPPPTRSSRAAATAAWGSR